MSRTLPCTCFITFQASKGKMETRKAAAVTEAQRVFIARGISRWDRLESASSFAAVSPKRAVGANSMAGRKPR